MSEDLNFLMKARREKLERLRAAGVEPFAYSFDRTHTAREAVALLGEGDEGPLVRVAGRLVSWRAQGKTAFAHLADMDGRIQLYLRRTISERRCSRSSTTTTLVTGSVRRAR